MNNETIKEKISEFKKEILPLCVSAETSYDPAKWTTGNPLAGHGAIVSLFLHNNVGADIVRCEPILPDGTKDAHYLNTVDGAIRDLTGEQYQVYEHGDERVFFSNFQPRTAEYLLSNENTRKRYEVFEEKARHVMAAKKFSFAA